MSTTTPQQHSMESLLDLFKTLSLSSTKTVQHSPSPTCEDHTENLKSTEFKDLSDGGNFVQAKNLFFKVPSKGGPLKDRLFLVCASTKTNIDVKKLSVRLGVKANSPLRLATAELFDQVLSIPAGSVNPFVMSNESAKNANVYLLLDKKGFKDSSTNKLLLFHPMRNDYTTAITCKELESFLDNTCGKEKYQFVDFSDESSAINLEASAEGSSSTSEAAKSTAAPKKNAKPAVADGHGAKEEGNFSPKARVEAQPVEQTKFADDHLFTIKKPEDTIFKSAFIRYEWVKV